MYICIKNILRILLIINKRKRHIVSRHGMSRIQVLQGRNV